ncbi:MAG: helix-turn-helix domain-containing protein [Deltaproteobacteria bacterium]|nr:helix-turn-helix domain-containing protein [Deltaproteobacteria bacterium]
MRPVEIKIHPHEKRKMQKIISQGECKARTINRCRILLLSAEKKSPQFISDALKCDPSTIRNVKQRYISGGIEAAIYDSPRSGAPTKFDGRVRAKITALACSKAPEGHAKWSLALLADKAVELNLVESISHTQVGTILKKTK